MSRDTACHCSYKKVGYMSTYAMLRITNDDRERRPAAGTVDERELRIPLARS